MPAIRWRPSIGAAVVLVALLAGCTSQEGPTPAAAPSQSAPRAPSGLDAEGVDAWQRWQSLELDNYRYRLQVGCFCPAVDDVVVVTRHQVTQVGGHDYRGRPVTGFDEDEPTIDALFEQVARATIDADEVDVRYDPVTGVPTSVWVDWMSNAIDDEISYRATRLESFVSL